jgi:actin-related protein
MSLQKVILTGGFGQSPSLRARLKAVLKKERNYLDQQIELVTPRAP